MFSFYIKNKKISGKDSLQSFFRLLGLSKITLIYITEKIFSLLSTVSRAILFLYAENFLTRKRFLKLVTPPKRKKNFHSPFLCKFFMKSHNMSSKCNILSQIPETPPSPTLSDDTQLLKFEQISKIIIYYLNKNEIFLYTDWKMEY